MSNSGKFTNLIKDLTKLKEEGNELYTQKNINGAMLKFKEAYQKYESEFSVDEHLLLSNNKDIKEILVLKNKILSNLALCHYVQGRYQEAIEYDKNIIKNEPKYAKSLVRLYNCYMKLNDKIRALFYGKMFIELENEEKNKFKGQEEIIKKEILKFGKSCNSCQCGNGCCLKFILPLFVLLLAAGAYWYLQKK